MYRKKKQSDCSFNLESLIIDVLVKRCLCLAADKLRDMYGVEERSVGICGFQSSSQVFLSSLTLCFLRVWL